MGCHTSVSRTTSSTGRSKMLGCKGTRAAVTAPLTASEMADARTGTCTTATPGVYCAGPSRRSLRDCAPWTMRIDPCGSTPADRHLQIGSSGRLIRMDTCGSAHPDRHLQIGSCGSTPADRHLRIGSSGSAHADRLIRIDTCLTTSRVGGGVREHSVRCAASSLPPTRRPPRTRAGAATPDPSVTCPGEIATCACNSRAEQSAVTLV
jgi:hypothetical protein